MTNHPPSPRAAPRRSFTTIRHGTAPTPVGTIFVALTDKGICALKIIARNERPMAVAEVQKMFPAATLEQDQKAVEPIVAELRDLLAGKRSELDTPLDMHGTPFQQHVWKVMRRVSAGETCSYTELAKRAGRPRAVRAVASACARNPVAILVPCHRILRSDGGLGGYRWGLKCKRALLKCERVE